MEWDAGELGVVPGLRDLGYSDAFRTLRGGWRLDHNFSSAELRPVRCLYHHAWRDGGLSDHSALEADLEFVDAATSPRA